MVSKFHLELRPYHWTQDQLPAGYGQVMHGEVVAIGMVQVSRVAEKASCQLGL